MTTGTQETDRPENLETDADAEAAFAAGFEGKDLAPPTAKQPTEKDPATEVDDEAAKAAAAQAAASAEAAGKRPDPDPKAATDAKDPPVVATPKQPEVDYGAEVRKLYGRIGQLTDEITKLKTGKETEGKPAVATPTELATLKAQYPEIAELLTADLAQVLTRTSEAKADPQEIETLVSQRVQEGVAREAARLRDAAVDDAHPTWRKDLFTEDPATKAKTPTADYLAWTKSIGEEAKKAFEGSSNPYHVIRQLNAFYEFKGKTQKQEDAKQARLKAAVQPQGTARGSPPNLSDDEAMRKGFEEGFNS